MLGEFLKSIKPSYKISYNYDHEGKNLFIQVCKDDKCVTHIVGYDYLSNETILIEEITKIIKELDAITW